jgi:pimeloyl-ACP methyl ester carboxylesterase
MNGTGRARPYITGSVNSAGTTIGYRQLGNGPAVILLHGGMKSSQDFMKLAVALSSDFTVIVVDRRGRGLSGPHGDGFTVDAEVADVQALVAAMGARHIFGLSSGALVALRAVWATASLERVAFYEPPLSIGGSVPTAWLPQYKEELARGKPATALVTVMKGLEVVPMFARLPRFLLVPLLSLVMRLQGVGDVEHVPIRALVPTFQYDMQIVKEMSDTLDDYRNLSARVLLFGGTKSPAFLGVALDALERRLPHVERVTLPGLGHDGPEDDGRPALVAQHLRRFFG